MSSCLRNATRFPNPYIRAPMREALQALLRQASDAKRSADFWRGAATILSDWAGGARLAIRYQGINESGTVAAAATDGLILRLDSSTTGRVVRTGEALMSADLRAEPDASPIATRLADGVRAALIAPLRISQGTVGAVGLLRYQQADTAATALFSLHDLHYVSAVAAHIAGGIELSEAVAATRAAADRARAMVNASPLPMALVDTAGMVRQVNDAALQVFGVKTTDAAVGRHLEKLG